MAAGRAPDVAVIGGGPAGLAAAAAARETGARVILIERGPCLGGILNQCIHDGFGLHVFGEALTGPEFAGRYAARAAEAGVDVRVGTLVTRLGTDRTLTCTTLGRRYPLAPAAVVLAMGCRERTRGMLRIPGPRPAGIYTAGTAQALINEANILVGRRVVILGSGDIGLIMARRLTWEGANVAAVLEKLPYPSGLARNVRQCLEDYKIPLTLSSTVAEVHGAEKLEGVTAVRVDAAGRAIPETAWEIPCDTLLLSVGLIPENEISRQAGIPIDPRTGGAHVDARCMTDLPGVFACGNVLHIHDVADWAAEEGEHAGQQAARFAGGDTRPRHTVDVRPGDGIRYVLPQRIPADASDSLLSMRVGAPGRDRRIRVRCADRLVLERDVRRAVPAEMIRLRVRCDGTPFSGPVEVELR